MIKIKLNTQSLDTKESNSFNVIGRFVRLRNTVRLLRPYTDVATYIILLNFFSLT